MVLDHGCSISATPLTEMLNNNRGPLLKRVTAHGAVPSLGTDTDIYFNSSMLAVTRHAFLHEREADNSALDSRGAWPSSGPHSMTTREALAWTITGGARALRLEHSIGSISLGKQADLIMVKCDGPSVYPAMEQGGDPFHALVMYAEAADVDTVLVAGKLLKHGGVLRFPEQVIRNLADRLRASRSRVMGVAGFE